EERGDAENEGLAAFLAFYRQLEEMALPLETAAADLAPVALGLLNSHRSAPTGWAHVAGELLHEDIEGAAELWLPLLTLDLDERARQAARDAWRARYREGFAEQRGGPGYSWACACGVTHLWYVPRCATCYQDRPQGVGHEELDVEEHDSAAADPEARARMILFLESLKRRHGDSKSYRAFEAYVLEGGIRSVSEAAASQGIHESVLREYIRKYLRELLKQPPA